MLAVFGALAGARRINDAASPPTATDSRTASCCTSPATRDYDAVREPVTRAARPLPRRSPTTDRFWTVLAAADLCVSRAGGTVFELAAAGLPALLVPVSPCHGRPSARSMRALRAPPAAR